MRLFTLMILVSGAALARSEERSVPEFSAVHVAGGIHATVELGRQSVRVEAEPSVLALVETRVEDGVLKVGFREHEWIRSERDVNVSISAPQLRAVSASGGSIVKAQLSRGSESAIEASGGSRITARGVDCSRLALEASGGSDLVIGGSADEIALQLSGGSQLHGRDFSARDASLHGSGGSQAELKATGKVHGSLSGGSQLNLTGGASTRIATSGGSEVYSE